MSDNGGYISIPGWRTFQHYNPEKRGQPWIKDYLEQLDDDDYRALSFAQRGLLQDLRRAYARSRSRLNADTVGLSRRLGAQVTRRQLDALVQAGFIRIVASEALADGYHVASRVARAEGEGELEIDPPYPHEVGERPSRENGGNPRANGENPRAVAIREGPERKARAWIANGLAAHVPDVHLEEVLLDEFGPMEPELVAELAQEAREART